MTIFSTILRAQGASIYARSQIYEPLRSRRPEASLKPTDGTGAF
jgi:hypothetical protein